MKTAQEWLKDDKHLDSLNYEYEEMLALIRAIQADALASVKPIVPTSSGNSTSQLNQQSSQANGRTDALGGDINSASTPKAEGAKDVQERAREIVDRIFKADAQYKGGTAVFANRGQFNSWCASLIAEALASPPPRGDGLREALEPFAVIGRAIGDATTDSRWLEHPLFFAGTTDDPQKWTLTGRAFDNAAKALDASPATGWMPIESAPKDGSAYMVYLSDVDGIARGAWDGNKIIVMTPAHGTPTHWQKLPEPPK